MLSTRRTRPLAHLLRHSASVLCFFPMGQTRKLAYSAISRGLSPAAAFAAGSPPFAQRVKLNLHAPPTPPPPPPSSSAKGPKRAPHPDGSILIDAPPAIGYPTWKPGDPLRYAWPLFGQKTVAPAPPEVQALSKLLFGSGAKYIGDEADFCRPGAPTPTWIELPVMGRSNVGKSSLLNALLGSDDHSFVPVSKLPGSTRHIDFYAVGDPSRYERIVAEANGAVSRGAGSGSSKVDPAYERSLLEAKIAQAPLGGAAPRKNGNAAMSTPNQGRGQRDGSGQALLGKRRRDGTYERLPVAPSQESKAVPLLNPFAVSSATSPQSAPVTKADLVLVDTPGYGFNASRGKTAEYQWMDNIRRYLVSRPPHIVPRVLVLIDSRTGVTPSDQDVLSLLDESATPYQLVLTKADAVSPLELEVTAEAVARAAAKAALPYPVLCAVSSKDGKGMQTLKEQLLLSTRLHRRVLGGGA